MLNLDSMKDINVDKRFVLSRWQAGRQANCRHSSYGRQIKDDRATCAERMKVTRDGRSGSR